MTSWENQKWFYAVNDQRQGPISFDDLRRIATQGKLGKDDLVWSKGMSDWQPASTVDGLFAQVAPASASPTRANPHLAPPLKPEQQKVTAQLQTAKNGERKSTTKLPLFAIGFGTCAVIAATAYWLGTRTTSVSSQATNPAPMQPPPIVAPVAPPPAAAPAAMKTSPTPQPESVAVSTPQIATTEVAAPDIRAGNTYTYESVATDADGKITNSLSTRQVKSVDGGRVTVAFTSGSGKAQTLVYDNQWNFVESGDTSDAGLVYSPPIRYFDFPLTPGKRWSAVSTETNKKTGKTRQFTINAEVVGVDSNIGTLDGRAVDGVRIKSESIVDDGDTRTSGTDISWYVPSLGRSVYSKIAGQFADGRQDSKTIRLVNFTPNNSIAEQTASVAPAQSTPRASVAAAIPDSSPPSQPAPRPHAIAGNSEVKILRRYAPKYPPQAVRENHTGKAVLKILVAADGSPKDIEVESSSGFGELDQAAIAAARTWTFSPKMVDGEPQEAYVIAPVDFTLSGAPSELQQPRLQEQAAVQTSSSASAAPAPQPEVPSTPTVAVDSISFGHSASANGEIRKPDTEFGDKDTIFASIRATVESSTAQSLDVVWASSNGQILQKDRATLTSGPHISMFNYNNPQGLPVGQYNLGVYVGGKLVSNNSFSITPSRLEKFKNGLEKFGIKVQTH